MEFEDILAEVGDYGKYQKKLMLIFLFPSAALLPWFTLNIIFMNSVPDHWCHVPEVVNSNLTIAEQHSLIRPPQDPSCLMYDLNYTEMIASGDLFVPNNSHTMPCMNGWQYDKTNYEDTAATKWNMVCSNGHYPSLVLTLINVGSIIGTPIYGTLSDRIGRKPVFFVVILVTAITAITSVLMTNFIAFLVLRTINGSLMPSVFQLPYIILLELVGPQMRTRLNGIANASWTFGLCILPLIAYLSRHWVTLGLITSCVTVLFFMYWTFLPESPRWLLARERYMEAAAVLTKIAETNGKPQDQAEIYMKLQKLGERIKKEKKIDSVTNTSADLLRFPQLRKKFFIITFCWVADMFAYYGLQYNVANLGGNEFLNFFLLALVEAPGFFCSWLYMEYVGRRWCSVLALSITGIACLFPVMIQGMPYVAVVSSLIGKFGASASFMAVYQQSSELYPTTVRSIGMGLSGTFAGMANIIIPYIVYLAIYGSYIPFMIIALTCLFAALAASFLPETLNENLPQTIFDAENFGLEQKYFSCKSRKRPRRKEECLPNLLTINGTCADTE